MTTKPVKRKGAEDFLGLFTLGSLIGNIVQADQRKTLRAHYDNMVRRYKQLYNAYQSMKRVYDGLVQEAHTLNAIIRGLREENNRLLKELALLREENIRLKSVKTEGPIRRRQRLLPKKNS